MNNLSFIISKMLQHPENVIGKVLDAKKENPKRGMDSIASMISNNLGYVINGADVKEILQKAKELLGNAKSELAEMNSDIQDEKKYEFEDDHYIIYKNVNTKEGKSKERYKLPLSLVDNIFNDYSRHGGNMSGPEIMAKYSIKAAVWNLIKSNIGLYKDSNILSPMSMDKAAAEGKVDEVIRDATYENFQDKYKHKYKEAHIITLEKEYKKLARAYGTLDGFLEYITPMLNTIQPLSISVKKHKKTTSSIPVYHFGDTHLGKAGTDKVIERMNILASDIASEKSDTIYINCLGDIFETLVQGGMHSGQIEGMDGVYGADLFMFAVNTYVDFLQRIIETGKTIHFIGIGGNHDRGTILNKDDNERMYATIFYEMLKAYLAQAKIEFQIVRDTIGSFEVDGIQYLSGHEGIHNKKPEQVAWKFADTGKHIIYSTAHIHNEQVYTGKNVTQLIINALAGENDYDKRLGLHSYPGYTKTYRNEYGIPNIESHRLP